MYTEVASLHKCCEGEIVEYIRTHPPHIDRSILAKAFVIKPIDLTDLTRFVITTKERNSIRITNFQCKQQKARFHTIVTSIYIISHEQVGCSWAVSSYKKQLPKVIILSMYITADLSDYGSWSFLLLRGPIPGGCFPPFAKSPLPFRRASLLPTH